MDVELSKRVEEIKKIRRIFQEHDEEWREMENGLGCDSFWYFISNEPKEWNLRISIILDILTSRPKTLYSEDFYFNFFESQLKDGVLKDCLWANIQKIYETLWNWYEDGETYHKIGYLICASYPEGPLPTLSTIYHCASDFEETWLDFFLENLIKESLDPKGEMYLKRYRYKSNIEFYRNITMRLGTFPFDKYKKFCKD